MLRMSATTKLTPEEGIKEAVKFFGPEGYQLTVRAQEGGYAAFDGGGGYVEIEFVAGDKTAVELVSREWDYQTKEFITKIAQMRSKSKKKDASRSK
jgi:hypothetical protein